VAVAGESDASRSRIETLLPGVHVDKPTAVARACDLLLLTVPDDMLANVATMLSASGAIRDGQYVVHTSGRHGLAVLEPAADLGAHVLAMHPAMTFTGTDLDLGRLPGCVFGVTSADDTKVLAETLVSDLRGSTVWVPEERRTLYHAGLAHGANHLVTLETVRLHLADITANAPDTLDSYVAMARATADRAVVDGRLLPIRADKLNRILDGAVAGVDA
jgi:predicted short-subunit dehydrogenase-like oxidoreductase (DUF2520 family)